jgi:ABC-type molybdate transport system permease subunit
MIAFFVGLAAHVAGYLLKSASPAEPIGLAAELLYALGFAMWTGVVVALFVQVLPAAKRRQIQQAVEAVEASMRAEEKRGSER